MRKYRLLIALLVLAIIVAVVSLAGGIYLGSKQKPVTVTKTTPTPASNAAIATPTETLTPTLVPSGSPTVTPTVTPTPTITPTPTPFKFQGIIRQVATPTPTPKPLYQIPNIRTK